MAKFKAGDKVRLSQVGVNTYPMKDSNPRDVEGVVRKDREADDTLKSDPLYFFIVEAMEMRWEVTWPNGTSNSYADEDLDLVA